jgi:hypothetical protein
MCLYRGEANKGAQKRALDLHAMKPSAKLPKHKQQRQQERLQLKQQAS